MTPRIQTGAYNWIDGKWVATSWNARVQTEFSLAFFHSTVLVEIPRSLPLFTEEGLVKDSCGVCGGEFHGLCMMGL